MWARVPLSLFVAVFPLVVDRPEMLCIMAGMYQKDSGSGMCKAGFSGFAPRAVFLPSVVMRKLLDTWAVMNQKDSYRWPVHGWYCWLWCSRAVFPFSCRQALLDKLVSPVVVQRQVSVLVWTVLRVARGDSTGAILGRSYGHYDKCRAPDSANRLEVPQLQLMYNVVFTPVVAQSLIPMAWQTIEIPRTLGGRCPCCALQHPCRGAEAVSHGPDGSADHGHSPATSLLCISGAVCERTIVFPQLQLVVFLLGQRCCMPVVCNDRCRVVRSAENCVGPTVAVL